MKKYLSKWFYIISQQHSELKPLSIQEQQRLQRDLDNCFTLQDITTIKEVLRLCSQDFSDSDLLTFLLNIDYRKRLIQYCNTHLSERRYTVNEIHSFFINTGSYAVCDAILLHCRINQRFYFSIYKDLPPMQTLEIFERMATKQKTFIYEKYLLQKQYA